MLRARGGRVVQPAVGPRDAPHRAARPRSAAGQQVRRAGARRAAARQGRLLELAPRHGPVHPRQRPLRRRRARLLHVVPAAAAAARHPRGEAAGRAPAVMHGNSVAR